MSIETALARVVADQGGVFTRKDARKACFSEDQIADRLADERWMRELPSVYRFAATPSSSHSKRWAALLWGGEKALLSHETAAEVWELDGVPASERIHIVVPASRRLRSVDVVVHRIDVSPRERRYVDGLRVTRPELTLMHLAATLNGEQLESAFECARRQRLVTAASVSDLLERSARRGRNGVGPLRALVTLIGGEPPTESVLEVKVARLLRASGLPKAVRQHAIGRLRVDFAWPLLRVVLECDGYRLHSDCFQRDRSRWSELASQGWRVIVVTWDDVMRRSEFVVTQIRDALAFAA